MVVTTLAVQGALQLGIGVSFALVAQVVRRRPATEPDAKLALRAFLAWWYGLGGYIAILGTVSLVAAFGFAPMWMFALARLVDIPMLAASLWGMITYVTYMWRGDTRVSRFAVAYATVLAAGYYATSIWNTSGIEVKPFSAGFVDTDPLWMNLVYVWFAVPLLACIVAYGLLVRRVQGAEQRYRIGMVATSLLLWVVSGLVGEVSGNRVLAFASVSAFGLGTSLVLLLAYRPPAALRHWLQERDARNEVSAEQAAVERARLAGWGPERPS